MFTFIVGNSTGRNMLYPVLPRIFNSIDGYTKEVTTRAPHWVALNAGMMILLRLENV